MSTPRIAFNRIGWFAIKHKDGSWVGTDKGVTCYQDDMDARAALTILWQRDGGGALKYRIFEFTGANAKVGQHTPQLSAETAVAKYENKNT